MWNALKKPATEPAANRNPAAPLEAEAKVQMDKRVAELEAQNAELTRQNEVAAQVLLDGARNLTEMAAMFNRLVVNKPQKT